jgi:hypothetical protein
MYGHPPWILVFYLFYLFAASLLTWLIQYECGNDYFVQLKNITIFET